MATKKQKRLIGEKKHMEFMADVKRSGLEAQHKEREHRTKKLRRDWETRHESHSVKKPNPDCPHCHDMRSKVNG